MIQTAEGALTEVTNMVNRIRELAVQGANDTNTTADRAKMAAEVAQLMTEIDATSDRTEFNQQKILAGKAGGQGADLDITFQIGANNNQSLTVGFSKVNTDKVLNLKTGGVVDAFDLTAPNAGAGWTAGNTPGTSADFGAAIAKLDTALEGVAAERAKYGATQNRLEYTINNLNLSSENLNAARSRIEDADMAKEMMNLTSANVLQQAATSMLAQANQAPNNITQLLG